MSREGPESRKEGVDIWNLKFQKQLLWAFRKQTKFRSQGPQIHQGKLVPPRCKVLRLPKALPTHPAWHFLKCAVVASLLSLSLSHTHISCINTSLTSLVRHCYYLLEDILISRNLKGGKNPFKFSYWHSSWEKESKAPRVYPVSVQCREGAASRSGFDDNEQKF